MSKKKHEEDGLVFRYLDDLRLYRKLKEKVDEGQVSSYDIDTLLLVRPEDSKYKARKVVIDKHVFDSKLEARYYLHLLDKKENKKIVNFKLKPSFELLPAFEKNGRRFRKINYIADFEVENKDGSIDIIDTKGMITPDFSLKEKLFEYKFPNLNLKVLKYVKSYGGWIEHHKWREERNRRRREARKKERQKK